MKSKSVSIAISAIAAVWLLTAAGCNSTGCTDNRSSIPLAGFYSAESGQAVSLDALEITGVGAPADAAPLLAAGTAASEVYLPLRPSQDQTTFEIRYTFAELADADVRDYITIHYESHPYFASEDCGAMYRYLVTSIVHTSEVLEAVEVIPDDKVITNAPVQNMRLFFRVTTNPPAEP